MKKRDVTVLYLLGTVCAILLIMLRDPATAGLRTKSMKLTQALAVALTSLWVGTASTEASPVLCSNVSSLGDWAASADGCTDAEVRYTLIESTLPSAMAFGAASILLPSGTVHIVDFDFYGVLAPGTYVLDYYMELTALNTMFGSVRGDTSVAGRSSGTNAVVTNVFDSQGNPVAVGLASVNGAPTSLEGLPIGLRFLDVRETFVVQFGTAMFDAANAYTQLNTSPVAGAVRRVVQVTGPASLILLGLGLLSMSLLGRKIAA